MSDIQQSLRRFIFLFSLFALIYFLMNFVLFPQNHLLNYPLQHDDYMALSMTFSTFHWPFARPVLIAMGVAAGHLGRIGYDLLNQGYTVLYAVLVLEFASLFFVVKLPLRWILLYAALVFAPPYMIDWGHYLGVFANGVSTFFGILALLALFIGWRDNKYFLYILSGFFYTLSAFSKEDFLLPGLILGLYLFAISFINQDKNKKILFLVGYFILTIIAVFSYNKYVVHSVFTADAGNSSDYTTKFSLASIIHVMRYYLVSASVGYAGLLSGFVLVASLISLFYTNNKEFKLKLVVWGAMAVSLVMPYTVLPKHLFAFYMYNWVASFTVFNLQPEALARGRFKSYCHYSCWRFRYALKTHQR